MKLKVAAFSLAAIAALAIASQDAVTLRRDLKAGTSDYKVTMDSTMTLGGPMGEMEGSMKGTMKVSMKTADPKDGKSDLEIVTTDISVEYGGAMQMASGMMPPLPKEMKVTGKIDERNRLSDMKMPGASLAAQMMMGQNMQSMSGQVIEFPEGPVKVGDTWTIVLPKNEMMGTAEAKMTGKLVSDVGNAYKVSVTGKIPMKMDMAEMVKKYPDMASGMPPMNVVVESVMDVTNDALIEKGTGRMLEVISVIKSTSKANIVDMGMTTDQKATMTIKMALDK